MPYFRNVWSNVVINHQRAIPLFLIILDILGQIWLKNSQNTILLSHYYRNVWSDLAKKYQKGYSVIYHYFKHAWPDLAENNNTGLFCYVSLFQKYLVRFG